MSLLALFEAALPLLDSDDFGTKIRDVNGKLRDTGVNVFRDVMKVIFNSQGPIDLSRPIVINNHTDGPAIIINNMGPTNQTQGVQIGDEAGHQTGLGIGLGNQGIIANWVTPIGNFALNPNAAQYFFSQNQNVTYADYPSLGIPVPPGANPSQTAPGFYTPPAGGYTPPGANYVYQPGQPVGGGNGAWPFNPAQLALDWMMDDGGGGGFGCSDVADCLVSGCGILISGTTISFEAADVAGCGLVNDGACTLKVDAATLAGDGLGTSGTCTLKVNVDASTIEINADTLRVKDGGITTAKLADGAVTTAKIADNAVTSAKTSGTSGSTNVVTAVSCSGGTLSVTTASWTFTNGLRTA